MQLIIYGQVVRNIDEMVWKHTREKIRAKMYTVMSEEATEQVRVNVLLPITGRSSDGLLVMDQVEENVTPLKWRR